MTGRRPPTESGDAAFGRRRCAGTRNPGSLSNVKRISVKRGSSSAVNSTATSGAPAGTGIRS